MCILQSALNISSDRGQSALLKLLIEFLIWPKPQLVIQVRTGDLFWNYTDHFLQKLYDYKEFTQVTAPYINLQYNNSDYDRLHPSIIFSGETNSQLTAQLIQWAGMKTLSIWRNYSANKITGTEGMVWQPFLKQSEEIVGFISDAER